MAIPFLDKLIGGGVVKTAEGIAGVIDRFVETKEEKKAAEALKMKIKQEPDKWQMEINKIEAGHRTIFVAGWRPFIGWICGFSLGAHFLLFPLLAWFSDVVGTRIDPPAIEVGALFSIVTAMLGLGAARSYEKKKGLTP